MALNLSYILPCYNVERYVAECLDGIYAQGMQEDEFEVICVDDCSTDNTCKVIEERQSSHSNLRLIRHSKNSRSGIARNTGIKNAVGDYLCFVDADDMLPPKVMKDICSVAQEEQLDILLYNNLIFYKGALTEESIKYSDSDVLSGGDFVQRCLHGKIGKIGAPWAKLFRRSFLLQHSIWYSDLIVSQDVPFVWEAMICANRVKSISKEGYIYRGNDSSMTSRLNYKTPNVLYSSSILYPNTLIALLERYGNAVPDVIRIGIENEIKTETDVFFRKYLSYKEEGRKVIYSMIRQNTAPIRKLRGFMNRKQKVAFLSRKMGYGIFDAFVEKLFL